MYIYTHNIIHIYIYAFSHACTHAKFVSLLVLLSMVDVITVSVYMASDMASV